MATIQTGRLGPGERALIEGIRRRCQPHSALLQLGIGDDCALVRPPAGREIAVTTDFTLEAIHFRRDWHPPESVGHRCLARGLSDLAAMGAQPLAAFLSLAAPPELTLSDRLGKSWVDRFLDGLLTLAAEWKVPLAGGDTAQSPVPSIARHDRQGPGNQGLVAADIVVLGSVARGRALRRSGARAEDILCVTGALGGAAAELLALERDPRSFRKRVLAVSPHLYPVPRIGVGRTLVAKRLATAAIDVSDGLSTDLRHLCDESALAAELDAASIPVHPLAEAAAWAGREGFSPGLALQLALHGGEDYELLFTVPRGKRIPAKVAGIPVHAIGRMKRKRRGAPLVELLDSTGKKTTRIPLEPGGWQHFSQG